MSSFDFDVVVIGGGHAGIEAALASSRLGQRVALVTTNRSRIGFMSCNPAIGGLAKGHMVREIDALGGQMALTTDASTIQFKRLNTKKGPAVRGSRSQCDKDVYCDTMVGIVSAQPGLDIIESEVKRLILTNRVCQGVVLADGSEVRARAVIVTTGTFMRGLLHFGLEQVAGGRVGDSATVGISDQLRAEGFSVLRLKTGTPARLDRDSIDFSKTDPQPGDSQFYPFSFFSKREYQLPQVDCYLTYTNEQTHDVIRKNLSLSPMYCGVIEGVGPRYCPSIEDKVMRFADKDRHQTFLEPEGLATNSIYLQGMSTSLPAEVQDAFIRTIPGLESVRVLKYGYAVEYDSVEPTQIRHTLETKPIRNLFLAGQINGTSGYEEAAAQGFVAGVNAARSLQESAEFVMLRHESYIGVMIDDLVLKGTREPYRMFTSRAEHRLVLREDNTLERLGPWSERLGLISNERRVSIQNRSLAIQNLQCRLKGWRVFPSREVVAKFSGFGLGPLINPLNGDELLRRPDVDFGHLRALGFEYSEPSDIEESVTVECKYSGYITRQNELLVEIQKFEEVRIPESVEFSRIRGLSNEEVEKLSAVRPSTVGQASRMSGVNPSAIQALVIHLKSL